MRLVEIEADGSGRSGNWVARPDRREHLDKVIIYNRLPEQKPPEAEVYLADFVGTAASDEEGRLVVEFRNANQVGTTNRNWREFADARTSPVRYLSKK